MRNELQVLTRAVSILFTTHPNPVALKQAWQIVIEDLRPRELPVMPNETDKKIQAMATEQFRGATKLLEQIGRPTGTK